MEYKKLALISDIPVSALDSGSSGLDIIDEDGNIILSIQDGHIQTKYFNSSTNALPDLPADVSAHTYILKAINGTLTWVLES